MTLKKPWFIVEISANHCGNINLAKKLMISFYMFTNTKIKL